MRYWLSISLCLCLFTWANAQELAYGFKAGLNFSTLTGEDEASEVTSYTTGFHIGLLLDLAFTDNFGLRSELLYTQKGKDMTYNGESYFVFEPAGLRIATVGTRDMGLNVSTSYAQLPIMGYAKFGKFELMAGAYASIRLGAIGNGSMKYSSTSLGADAFDFNLFHIYGKDKAATFGGTVSPVFINGNRVEIPTELGAYYEFADGPAEKLYKVADLGLVAGASFYLGKALFFNARLEYGLMDVTNDAADVSLARLNNNNQLQTRADNDRNLAIHTALGFRF